MLVTVDSGPLSKNRAKIYARNKLRYNDSRMYNHDRSLAPTSTFPHKIASAQKFGDASVPPTIIAPGADCYDLSFADFCNDIKKGRTTRHTCIIMSSQSDLLLPVLAILLGVGGLVLAYFLVGGGSSSRAAQHTSQTIIWLTCCRAATCPQARYLPGVQAHREDKCLQQYRHLPLRPTETQ